MRTDTELATKKDLEKFATKEDLEKVEVTLKKDLANAKAELIELMATKEDLADTKEELVGRIIAVNKKVDERTNTILAAMDELRHDVIGAFQDDMKTVKNRLDKLEERH